MSDTYQQMDCSEHTHDASISDSRRQISLSPPSTTWPLATPLPPPQPSSPGSRGSSTELGFNTSRHSRAVHSGRTAEHGVRSALGRT